MCRMSNLGADDYQGIKINGTELYKIIASDAVKSGATGVVVGCTNPVELKEVRAIIGEEMFILSPGFGPQGGDPSIAFRAGANSFNENIIIVSSRSINYAYEYMQKTEDKFAEAAVEMAKRKKKELNEIRDNVRNLI